SPDIETTMPCGWRGRGWPRATSRGRRASTGRRLASIRRTSGSSTSTRRPWAARTTSRRSSTPCSSRAPCARSIPACTLTSARRSSASAATPMRSPRSTSRRSWGGRPCPRSPATATPPAAWAASRRRPTPTPAPWRWSRRARPSTTSWASSARSKDGGATPSSSGGSPSAWIPRSGRRRRTSPGSWRKERPRCPARDDAPRGLPQVSTATAVAAAPVVPWRVGRTFLHPAFDVLVIGGGLSLVLTACLQTGALSPATAALGLSLPLLIFTSNLAHFASSTVRLYTKPDAYESHRFLTMGLPLVTMGVLALAVWQPEAVGRHLQALYLTWSPYHYAAQAYGVAMMYCYRSGCALRP